LVFTAQLRADRAYHELGIQGLAPNPVEEYDHPGILLALDYTLPPSFVDHTPVYGEQFVTFNSLNYDTGFAVVTVLARVVELLTEELSRYSRLQACTSA
jgi:hypothetical protein